MELGLVAILRAAWIAGTLPILLALLPSARLSTFRGFVLGFAKRGKIMQSSSRRFGVPQKFFSHFYVVAAVWTTFLMLATWFYAHKMARWLSDPLDYPTIATHLTGGSGASLLQKSHMTGVKLINKVWQSVFMLLLMDIQVLRRLYESIYVFNYSPSARMHIFGYLTGLFFYTAAPLSLCCIWAPEVFKFVVNGVAEFILKGKNQMHVVEYDLWQYLSPPLKLSWYQWIGAAIFFWGWVHQRRCHAILGSLREHVDQVEEYAIPYGDWFEAVSSPHYLAEIVIYAGLMIASGGTDLTIWLLFGFVVANLALAAGETQRWYLLKFDNYPRERFAIIPYVY